MPPSDCPLAFIAEKLVFDGLTQRTLQTNVFNAATHLCCFLRIPFSTLMTLTHCRPEKERDMNRTMTLVVPAVSALSACITANAATLTVCSSGCQYTSINAAIDDAGDGDVIELVAETYSEGAVIDLDGKNISLRGAVDSDGAPLSVLNGNSTHAVIQSSGGMITLENLVIENGSAANGAGLNYTVGSLTALNCIFRNNVASDPGGAIHAVNAGVTLTGCRFENNAADEYAGAIYGDSVGFVFSGCHFDDNQADYVPCVQGENCTFEMSDSTIVNHSDGEYLFELGTGVAGTGITTISNCVFENNEIEYNLLNIDDVATAKTTQLQITGCIFRGNEIDECCISAKWTQLLTLSGSLFADNLGDALSFLQVTGSVEDCRFERNSGGGTFYVRGDTTTLDFRRCVWANNVVSFRNQIGGGVVTFDACDFYGNQNTANGDSRPAALMVGSNATAVTITNSMFANNGSPAIHTDGELSIGGSYLCNQVVEGQTQEQWDDGSNTILSGDAETVCPDGDGDGVPDALDLCFGGDDGMDSDFDGTADDCDALPADPTEQLDSDNDGVGDNADACPDDPAKTEPGTCGCGVVDTILAGDLDCDGDVDAADFALLRNQIGVDNLGCVGSDINGDGTVNGADLAYILSFWGATCP